jgi:thiamine transport system permease protein
LKHENPIDLTELGAYALLSVLCFIGALIQDILWIFPSVIFFAFCLMEIFEKRIWRHTAIMIRSLDKISSKPMSRYAVYIIGILFFVTIILLPPILGITLNLNLFMDVVKDSALMSKALSAIFNSFAVAIFVGIMDLAAGIPTAWFIARGKSRWLNVIDTLADLPFIIPTVALGYSLLLFWNSSYGISGLFGGSLISPGWLLVILLHFVFSFPIVVRVMVGALMDYQYVYEEAARTLGAHPVGAERTVTFPILKPSMIGAFVLAFARSISETGATIIVAGTFENGAVFIQKLNTPGNLAPLVFASSLLILIAIVIFAIIQVLGPRLKVPIQRVSPSFEKKLSGKKVVSLRDGATLFTFFIIILLPALFVIISAFPALVDGTLNNALAAKGVFWQQYWPSLALSYFIGFMATLINVILGLPMAIMIARKRLGKTVSALFDILVNIPIIVPSVALGFSLGLFWRGLPFTIPELLLVIFAHISITYPYFVKSLATAISRVDFEMENAARILGARPFAVFRTIILPLVKYSFFAGAIIMFTRSVSETGATLAVISPTSPLKTVPVLLVGYIKSLITATGVHMSSEVGLGCGFLILFSVIILLVLRLVIRGRARY